MTLRITRAGGLWLSVLLGCVRASPSAEPRAGEAVHWHEVELEIRANLCIVELEVNGKTDHMPGIGNREGCQQVAAIGPIGEAVDAAFADAVFLLPGIVPWDRQVAVMQLQSSLQERSRRFQTLHMDNPAFLRVLLPRIETELAARSRRCLDCPSVPRAELRSLTWDAFSEYLVRQIWPHRMSPQERTAQETDEEYTVHVCTAVNGYSTMQDPEPALMNAAFVVVAHSIEVLENEVASAFAESLARTRDIVEPAREAAVQRTMAEIVANSAVIQREICANLRRFASDLLVEVHECGDL